MLPSEGPPGQEAPVLPSEGSEGLLGATVTKTVVVPSRTQVGAFEEPSGIPPGYPAWDAGVKPPLESLKTSQRKIG